MSDESNYAAGVLAARQWAAAGQNLWADAARDDEAYCNGWSDELFMLRAKTKRNRDF